MKSFCLIMFPFFSRSAEKSQRCRSDDIGVFWFSDQVQAHGSHTCNDRRVLSNRYISYLASSGVIVFLQNWVK